MATFTTFTDSSVPANPVYWVAGFKQFGSFQDGGGSGVVINYSFKESGSTPGNTATARALTNADKDEIRDALNKVTAVANVTFVEVAPGSADLLFAATSGGLDGNVGQTFFQFGSPVEVWARDLPPNTVADNPLHLQA